jgi:ABC-2 type transport system ATP-binding protein
MLKVNNLTHFYGPYKAIENLSFHIQPGKLVGFLGPNGAGKTTTMKIITGFTMPTEGEVWISDVNLLSHPVEAKKYLGYLPENPPLYADMTVADYLCFVATLKGLELKEARSSCDEMIEAINLKDVAKRPIYKLSKGFRQRVGLAQSFVSQPKLIILDEPTVGFDPQQAAEFRKLLLKFRGKSTIIWSTHILSDVESTCDEIIVINKGHIIAHGSHQEITKQIHGHKTLRIYVKAFSQEFLVALQKLKGVANVEGHSDDSSYSIQYSEAEVTDLVLEAALHNKVGVTRVESESKDLEGLFLELTNRKSPEVKS